jgi:hypothetical protein
MKITELADSYSRFYSTEYLKSRIESAVKFLPEEISNVLPSIQLGQDGLTLFSLFLITEKYLCEIRLMEANTNYDFDIVAKNTICNYRIKTWTHEIKEEGIVKASFEISQVQLVHGSPNAASSQLFFAGNAEGRDAWLNDLTQAIPIKLVLGFSRPMP